MTENKRFIASSGGIYDLYKSDRFVWSEWEEIIQIMNNLNEKAIERSKALSKLQKENEKLKSDNKCYVKRYSELFEGYIACKKENEQLKQQIKKLESQLYCPYDSICINCVNEYLVQKDKYYVSKCKKGHEQCSRTDVKYCDDFELKGDVE